MGKDLHPSQTKLEAQAEELRDSGQVVRIDPTARQREQRVDVEKELAADELSALVRRRKTGHLALQNVLHLLLDDDLLRLVQLEVSEGDPALARVPDRLRPERRHLI